jgi:pyruvate/2-oxoglutarate dehydrogenase complex dihydrolipoamide acyltransferase (E2) component
MQAQQPQRVIDYNHSLVKQAVQLLQQAWGTHMVLGINQDGTTAGMAAVEMPWPLAVPNDSSSSSRAKIEACGAGILAAQGSSSSPYNASAAAAAAEEPLKVVTVAVNGTAAEAHIPATAAAAAAATAAAAVPATVVAVAVNGAAVEADVAAALALGSAAAWAQPSAAAAAALNKYLREVHCIEVPVAYVAGRLFVRISAQVYNNIGDYQALADAVLGLAAAAAAAKRQ